VAILAAALLLVASGCQQATRPASLSRHPRHGLWRRRLHAQRERARELNDGALDEGRRFERDYVVAMLDGTLFRLESVERPSTTQATTAAGSIPTSPPVPLVRRAMQGEGSGSLF
jgi:hypothetical protein